MDNDLLHSLFYLFFMSQIKIFGIRESLYPVREKLSEVLHSCIMEAFAYPKDKRAHRFIYLEKDSFFYPDGRSDNYTIIEISLFEGRSIEAKKKLYQLIFERFEKDLSISPVDVEITLFETPMYNWGIRGKSGDELVYNYKVNV
jgi:phenylpyruvate tautomerase PptA (4-oxalocrotonate tautomerase family)